MQTEVSAAKIRNMKNNKIIILDIECTCWDPPQPDKMEIIEIGLCLLYNVSAQIERKASFIVRPQLLEVSEFCENLTGITEHRIKHEGRPLNEVLNTIKKLYPIRTTPIGAWGDSDRNFIKKECLNKNIEYPFNDRMGYVNVKFLTSMFLRRRRGLGLTKAISMLDMEFQGKQHRADDDAYNAARVLRKILGMEICDDNR